MTPNRDIQTLEKDVIQRLSNRLCPAPEKQPRFLVGQAFQPAQPPGIEHFCSDAIQTLERNKKKTMETPPAHPYNPHK